MKRWRYLCAAALIAGSMAAGASAVSIPSTALTQLQQQWQRSTMRVSSPMGRYFRRLSFRGQRPIPHSSVCARAKKNLYKISADSLYGIADLKTGKMIVPAEYTTIDVLSDSRFLLTRYENQASSFYYADASGTVTLIQIPVKGTYFGMAGDDCFFIGVYAKRPLTAAV